MRRMVGESVRKIAVDWRQMYLAMTQKTNNAKMVLKADIALCQGPRAAKMKRVSYIDWSGAELLEQYQIKEELQPFKMVAVKE